MDARALNVFDLGAYLARIGLEGEPTLTSVHRAHAGEIPFENLDPHRGVPVSLAPADLERKLVHQRRGGYCFEQNLLLREALVALGMDVQLMLARVRVGAEPGGTRPRTHLVLRVRDGGTDWQADVGFGIGTLLEPIPFGAGGPYVQSGWQFRLVEDDGELVLQERRDGAWTDLYGFAPEPVPLIDVEVSNWYASTHPRSPFVTGLIAAKHRLDGGRVSLSDWGGLALSEQTPTATSATPVARADVPELLAEVFGLEGFAVGNDSRIVKAD